MEALGWREIWPVRAMQTGGLLGVVGMVGGQAVREPSVGRLIFTAVFALAFLAAIWLLANGAARRLSAQGSDRLPEREPRRLVVIGLMAIAIVMWLVAGYGAFIVVLWRVAADAWYLLAYLGIALAATGATVIMRQTRLEWLAHYRRNWPSQT